jgi:enoyl-CoA hydratase/carnithine racemase
MALPLLVSDVGAVRVLTLNRPDARNALSGELITALYRALLAADEDDDVRILVITGADPAFCAGVDLKQAAAEGEAYFHRFHDEPCILQVGRASKPVIGAINGAAFTGGLEMALGCDFLVASERAVFADTHIRVGVLPGGGMTARLPQLVGSGRARRMSMTSEVIDAARAERIGLVTEVVPHEKLIARVLEIAGGMAELPGPAMRGLKEMFVTGAATVTGPALAAEMAIATRVGSAGDDFGDRLAAVSARNHRQLADGGAAT